jgi:hypothetical protein
MFTAGNPASLCDAAQALVPAASALMPTPACDAACKVFLSRKCQIRACAAKRGLPPIPAFGIGWLSPVCLRLIFRQSRALFSFSRMRRSLITRLTPGTPRMLWGRQSCLQPPFRRLPGTVRCRQAPAKSRRQPGLAAPQLVQTVRSWNSPAASGTGPEGTPCATSGVRNAG